jgi:hypothetical protein
VWEKGDWVWSVHTICIYGKSLNQINI